MEGDLRLAELMAALSLATDLGVGQPLEQALRTCLIAVGVAESVGLPAGEVGEVYYVALLRFLGCTADAHEAAQLVGGDEIAFRAAVAPVLGGATRELASRVMPTVGAGQPPLRRARLVAGMMTSGKARARAGMRAHCEVAESLAQRLGLAPGVRAGLAAAFEQWNGAGLPNGTAGDEIPVSARIVSLARDAEVLTRLAGPDDARAAIRRRRGAAYDPALVDALLRGYDHVTAATHVASPWDEVLAREPDPRPWVPPAQIDTVLCAFADFVDLKSPFTAGHSRGVAALAAQAMPSDRSVGRAALVHDLGRVSVPNGIWDKPGTLTDGEQERVRLHAYYTERILGRVGALAPLTAIAGMHHERLDGSGYHRGSTRGDLPQPARVLAAADVYQAMTQPRPHRDAFEPDRAATELDALARDGRLDPDAVRAVLLAAGHRPAARAMWPAGLSEREVEVLRLLCRGSTKKEIARTLSISPSTADHHVRHIYDKAGVQTRAGATLFAMEHDLLH